MCRNVCVSREVFGAQGGWRPSSVSSEGLPVSGQVSDEVWALARQRRVQRLEHHSRAVWVGTNYLISLKLNFSCKVEMKMPSMVVRIHGHKAHHGLCTGPGVWAW